MKKTFNISMVDSLSFIGPKDENIRLIEQSFKSKIVVRGDEIIVDGAKKEVEIINLLINDMIITINNKGFVEKDDVELLINLSKSGESTSEFIDGDSPIILHTHKGTICAKTRGQKQYFKAIKNNDIVFAIGPAGTGKTYQAVASAVDALKNKSVEKIIITRPAVEAGERLGFLPGDLKNKVDPYLTPLFDALSDMIPKDKLKVYLDSSVIEVAPLAYMRGRTLHNSFIILDEAQNATKTQMKMFLTRLGVTSKSIITGDVTQIDLPPREVSGLIDAMKVLKKIKGISFVNFDENDVVRHKLVKDIIKAYGDSNGK
tara:strand:- start:745 stop:1692 length:948 start_codon:yes stop_codon:yes gene_type:complete